MEELLAGLNEQQRLAVIHGEGPMLVVAGAGTGKTRVITARIAYLIKTAKAKPSEVLALTFTEKAAREMEQRLYDLVGWKSYEVPVMTFNAFGAELLGRFASHVGRSIRGGLLKDNQKSLLLRQRINEIELEYYGPQADWIEFLDGIVDYIGRLQNAGVSTKAYAEYAWKLRSSGVNQYDAAEQIDLAKLYTLYDQMKAETGTYDFHDQLMIPLQIIQRKSNLALRLRQEFRYVLVDEYQDTNAAQDQLLRAFVPPDGNIFAVGDDDQAIYGFRGADISNILSFAKHFSTNDTPVLVNNYRSAQPILDAAYRLIQGNNPDRLELKLGINKRLGGLSDSGHVNFFYHETAVEERQAVVDAIAKRLEAGEDPSAIAVLSTRHAALAALAKDLRARQLPFALSTAVNIFEQPEIIGLWFLLRWLAWQIDEAAIAHVVMGPFIGWKAQDFRRVAELGRDQLISFEQALELDETEAAQDLISTLGRWRTWAQELSVGRLAYKLVFETGLVEKWQTKGLESARTVKLFEDLRRWFEQIQDFETVEIDTSVAEYCRQYQRPPLVEVREPVGDLKGVQLLTVHAAKGLEFDTVYMIGCSRRNWSPGRTAGGRIMPQELTRSLDLPPQHEFRRLMYVAVTRARHNLCLTAPRYTAGGLSEPVSPLVAELIGDDTVLEPARDSPSVPRADTVIKSLRKFYPLAEAQDKSLSLPFETGNGWLELSVTALSSYNFCPFDFYLQYVLKIQQPIGPQISFGTVLHRLFELYYKDKLQGQIRAKSDYHTILKNLWTERGYEDKREADKDRLLAARTLDQFLEREARSEAKIIGSEVKIGLELEEAKLRLSGKIDALMETSAGVEIRDFKTGRTKTDNARLDIAAKSNFQLRTYSLAYEAREGRPPARVALDYVVTGAQGVAAISPAILRNHRQKLGELAQRLRERDFAANLSALHTCAAVRYYGSGELDEWSLQAAVTGDSIR